MDTLLREQPLGEHPDALLGPPATLRLGLWSAWGLVGLYLAYAACVVASGVASGTPHDPAWAIAELMTIVGAPIQVLLFAVIHECAPPRARLFSLLAFGWMLAMATLTITVHIVALTVTRRIDLAADPGLARVLAYEWPSLLLGVEFTAWHLLFGLALLFAAPVFGGRGLAAAVRVGLWVGGVLCLVGVLGPALDKPGLRSIGVVGYALVPLATTSPALVCTSLGKSPPAFHSSRPGHARSAHRRCPAGTAGVFATGLVRVGSTPATIQTSAVASLLRKVRTVARHQASSGGAATWFRCASACRCRSACIAWPTNPLMFSNIAPLLSPIPAIRATHGVTLRTAMPRDIVRITHSGRHAGSAGDVRSASGWIRRLRNTVLSVGEAT
jgi:hypothetical protein